MKDRQKEYDRTLQDLTHSFDFRASSSKKDNLLLPDTYTIPCFIEYDKI